MDRRMDEKIYVPLKLPAIAHGPAADVQLLACGSLPRCVCVYFDECMETATETVKINIPSSLFFSVCLPPFAISP